MGRKDDATEKFFALRKSGFKGPIDQDGNPVMTEIDKKGNPKPLFSQLKGNRKGK
jgi:hypothetical protein